MFRYFTLSVLSLIACLSGGVAMADTASALAFNASAACETLEGYDPAYASHGDNYGQKLGRNASVDGFYQLAERDGKLYAAFAGAGGRQARGATPGVLVVLDAATLRHERSIALPFQAHALTLSPAGDAVARYAIATHTYVNAFSIIDLTTGAVRCLKPDVRVGDVENYRGRYVTADEAGNFYISYYSRKYPAAGEAASSVVMKYDANGEHVADFAINVIEDGMALPLSYLGNDELLVGGKSPKLVSARTGAVTALATPQEDLDIFSYVPGPGGTLLASNRSYDLKPNLVLFDVGTNSHSALYTGLSTLEVAYPEDSGQAFSTNFESRTLTVAALPGDMHGFARNRFVNIPFEGRPTNLLARRAAGATEVFVTMKHLEDDKNHKSGQLHKVRIDGAVRGIDGIDKPSACTVTTFDLADKSVSAPVACTVLDAKASYRRDLTFLQGYLSRVLKARAENSRELAEAQAALAQAQQSGASADAPAEAQRKVAAAQKAADILAKAEPATRTAIDLVGRLIKGD